MPYLITTMTPRACDCRPGCGHKLSDTSRLAVRHLEEVYERFDVPAPTADESGRLADPLTPGSDAPFVEGSFTSTAGATIHVQWITNGDLLHLHQDRADAVVVDAFNDAEHADAAPRAAT